MPSNHYSAFDRGFDLGHADVPPTMSPVLGRHIVSKRSRRFPAKIIMAVAAVAVMIVAAFTALQSATPLLSPPTELPMETQAPGDREVTYELSHFFESYLKNTNYAYQGNRTATPGLNTWWAMRVSKYGELIVHNTYPFITAYTLESQYTKPDIDPGFGLQTMARLHIVAKNITTIGTSAPKDPLFVPILNATAPGGGTVTLQWRSDIATGQEILDIKAAVSTHFARTYYLAPRIALQDDGYWHELYGHMTFDRPAAHRFLGIPATGDMRTEFTTANAGNAIGVAWLADWSTEGGAGGIYDTASAYEFADDIRQMVLTLDPLSTADLLNIRIWSISWGNDMLLNRWFEASGINAYMQSYFEDQYINATIGPTKGDMEISHYIQYGMLGWVDQVTGKASWMLEAQSIDYIGNTATPPSYVSKFNPYDPVTTSWTRLSRFPGTTQYNNQVSYYTTPLFWNLQAGEKFIVKLPTRLAVGYSAYVGASDTLNAAKATELNSHAYWGEVVMGHCLPELMSSYNHATKTLTVVGPTSFSRNPNPANNLINYTGIPMFVFDVSEVSTYDVKVLPIGGPYQVGVPYTVNVTARDFNGTAKAWNGTITLSSNAGTAVFGQTTYTFTGGRYWQTTVTFMTAQTNAYVNATDKWYPDVTGGAGPLNVPSIPEFGLLLVPVVGAAAMFIALKRRRES